MPASGATVYYMINFAGNGQLCPGLVGRQLSGGGRIISFGTLAGAFELQSAQYTQLLVNTVNWAVAGTPTAPGKLAARPAALSFYYQIGGPAPASQSISVSSSGAAVGFSAAVSTPAGGAWLTASLAAGATPATLSISVNPAGLTPGAYSGALNITGSGLVPQTVPISLTVATGVRVYIFSGGEPASDNAVSQALQNAGHDPNLGVQTPDFDGTQVNLTDFDVVVALYNENWNRPMTAAGKSALQSYLFGGGRLVTAEWFIYDLTGDTTLGPLLPATRGVNAANLTSATYTQVEPVDPIIQNGLPPSFTFSVSNYSDNGECLTPVSGATVFYLDNFAGNGQLCPGLVGRQLSGGGRIISFGTLAGPFEMQSAQYTQLFVNAVEWAAAGAPAPPSTLTVNPGTLTFNAQQGGSAPAAQSVSVSASGAAIAFNATVSTTSGAGWLSVSPATGLTPATLTVSANPTGLPPGVYSGAVSIIATGATPQVVPVSLAVISNCTYSLSPASQVFSSTGGTGTIGIVTESGCAWTAADNAPWVTITSAAAGSGTGTLNYSVAANTVASSRAASITIAGVTFTITESGTSALFLVGPSPLVFNFREGSVQTQQQFLDIYGSSPGLSFTETASGGAWLSVAPASGMAPVRTPIVTVNPSGLAAGSYQGTVTVTIANANPSVQTVSVEVFIEPAGPPHLDVEPAAGLSFSYTQGSAAQTSRLTVSDLGGGAVTFQATATAVSNGIWLSVVPSSGSATAAAAASIAVTADPTGLPAGTYTGSVNVVSPATGETAQIPITMTISSVQQTMLLSQTGLSYSAVAGGGSIPAQTVGVLNLGHGVMNWSASASTLSGGMTWLTVTPASGSTDAASLSVPLVNVAVDQTGLAPGEYYGQIQVSSPTADNSPQIVSVVLDVLPPGSNPGPLVRPTGLIFTGILGSAPAGSQVVTISNLSAGSSSFTSGSLTVDGTAWFNHLPAAGTVAPSQPATVLVQANFTGLTAGVRRGVLTLLFADGTVRTVNILLVLTVGASVSAKSPSSERAQAVRPRS